MDPHFDDDYQNWLDEQYDAEIEAAQDEWYEQISEYEDNYDEYEDWDLVDHHAGIRE